MRNLIFILLLVPALAPAQTVGSLERQPNRSQVIANRTPPGFRARMAAAPRRYLGPLRQEEIDAVPRNPFLTLRGVERALPDDVMSAGEWTTLEDGVRIWRLALNSEGASALRVRVNNLSAAAGSLWVYTPDREQSFGPFTYTDAGDDGGWWSQTAFGDTVVVEYVLAEGEDAPPFQIAAMAHIFPLTEALAAGSCELDVTCYPEWSAKASGVGMFIFQKSGGTYVCTGSLVNNTKNDGTPFFLTADHCVSDSATAATVNVFWNFQTPTCNGTAPSLSKLPQSAGATYLASKSIGSGDFSLLKLGALPSSANLVFYGWDASTTALAQGDAATGIHHPSGDFKRIAFGVRDADMTASVGSELAPASMYYQVRMTSGRIEPGSSGSPLFSAAKNIVGTLTYGPAGNACSISPFSAGYARFSVAYQTLSTYLGGTAPPAALTLTAAPASLQFSATTGGAAPAAQTLKVTTSTTATSTIAAKSGQAWLTVSPASVTASQSAAGNITVTVDATKLASGSNAGTITLTSGSATTTVAVVAVLSSANATPVTIAPTSMTFTYTQAVSGPAGQTVKVTPAGTASVVVTAKSSQTWLVVSPGSASASSVAPASFTVTLDPKTVPAGTLSGSITFSAGDGTARILSVQANVTAGAVPAGPVTVIPWWSDSTGTPSALSLVNPYSTATTAIVQFTTAGGTALSPALASGSATTVTIAPHGTATVATAGSSSPLKSGIAVISSTEAAKKIPATSVTGNDSIPAAQAVALPFVLPFDGTAAGTLTLMAYNAGSASALMSLTIYDASGAAAGSGQWTIPAGQQGALTINRTAAVFGGRKGVLVVDGKASLLVLGLKAASDGRLSAVIPSPVGQ